MINCNHLVNSIQSHNINMNNLSINSSYSWDWKTTSFNVAHKNTFNNKTYQFKLSITSYFIHTGTWKCVFWLVLKDWLSAFWLKCTLVALPGLSRGRRILRVSRILDLCRPAGQESHSMADVPPTGLRDRGHMEKIRAEIQLAMNVCNKSFPFCKHVLIIRVVEDHVSVWQQLNCTEEGLMLFNTLEVILVVLYKCCDCMFV